MNARRFRCSTAVGLSCAVLALASCIGAPVGVSPADPSAIQRELTSNVLNSGEPSLLSTQVLQRQNLYERWRREPHVALAMLHRRIGNSGAQYSLFALSELSYSHAQRSDDRSYYLASAVYAYALRFPGDGDAKPLGASDPRVLIA